MFIKLYSNFIALTGILKECTRAKKLFTAISGYKSHEILIIFIVITQMIYIYIWCSTYGTSGTAGTYGTTGS